MNSEPKLFERFANQYKPMMVPFMLLYITDKLGKASSVEYKEELEKLAGKRLEYQYTSFYRLIYKMRYEFEVIEEVELVKENGPARIYYGITPLGKSLMKHIYDELIVPIKKIDLDE